jgi:hypothetical protein
MIVEELLCDLFLLIYFILSISSSFSLSCQMLVLCGGSYRRGKALCSDMDFVITHPDGSRWMNIFLFCVLFIQYFFCIARHFFAERLLCFSEWWSIFMSICVLMIIWLNDHTLSHLKGKRLYYLLSGCNGLGGWHVFWDVEILLVISWEHIDFAISVSLKSTR